MTALEQPKLTRDERADELRQTTTSMIERLATRITEGYSDHFRQFLAFYSRFYQYSASNVALMMAQRPEAMAFGSYNHWQRIGRQVRRGARATWIWAPLMATREDEQTKQKRRVLVGFRPAPIFSDLELEPDEANPLPALHVPQPDDAQPIFDQFARHLTAWGVRVDVMPLSPKMGGFAQGGVRIAVNANIDSRNRVAVLIHEAAHLVLHQRVPAHERVRDQQAECEAEAIAYVLCGAIGLENALSSDYLRHWKVTPKQLQDSLSRIEYGVRELRGLLHIDDLRSSIDDDDAKGA